MELDFREIQNTRKGSNAKVLELDGLKWYLYTGKHYYMRKTKEGNCYLHHYVYEKFAQQKIPAGYVIHHKDGDTFNNQPDNLECLSVKKHKALHSRESGRVETMRKALNRKQETSEGTKRRCDCCGENYTAKNQNSKYCSRCQNPERRASIERRKTDSKRYSSAEAVCPVCRKKFIYSASHKIYCSSKCRDSVKRVVEGTKYDKTCKQCKRNFKTDSKTRKFCSAKCKSRFYYERTLSR